MKKLIALLLLGSALAWGSGELHVPGGIISNNPVSIGSGVSAGSSLILDLTSTTKGFAPPRMTTTQRNAISSPATGVEVYDTTLGALYRYNGSAWVPTVVGPYSAVAHQWINGISSSGVVSSSQPACGDLSNAAASCSTDTTNAGNISAGLLGLARGGTNVDLSATGGTSQVLMQNASHVISVAQLASSNLSDSANIVKNNQANTYSAGPQSLGTQSQSIQVPNDSGTGTTLNKLAKINTSGNAVIISTSDSSNIKGVVVAGAGTAGSADIAQVGQATCAFDGNTTAGDYVQASATVAGDCTDAGATAPTVGQVIGQLASGTTHTGASSQTVILSSGGGSAGFSSPQTTKGDLITYTSAPSRHAVPGDYGALVPDSSQTDGWRSASYTAKQNGRPGKNYIQYADFENNALTGWNWANVGTLTNGLPTGTPNFTAVNSNALYSFTISTSTTCAVGDTYTNNSKTFTIVTALSAQSGTVFFATGTGDPTASGTLTRATGAGTSSVTFSAFTKETMSVASSSQLAGTYSLSIATSGATVAGLGIATNSYAIDTADQAKVLGVKFYYNANTGASNANWSGTSSNSFAWAAYDVTNSAWLTSTSNFCMNQSSGVGVCTGTFQTGSSTANIRFVLYNSAATSGAVTLYTDDFFSGPQVSSIGPAITDWQTYTPTLGTGTRATTNSELAAYRRVGDTMEIQYFYSQSSLTGAASGSGTYTWSLPAGYSIDTSKITSNTGGSLAVGSGRVFVGASSAWYDATVYAASTTALSLLGDTGATSSAAIGSSNAGFASNAAMEYGFFARVPIVGWSSNSSQSSDSDGREVFAVYNGTHNAATSGTSIHTTGSTFFKDTHGFYNTSTGDFTIPVSGDYHLSWGINDASSISYSVYKNGSQIINGYCSSGSTGIVTCGWDINGLNANDTIDVRPNGTLTNGNPSIISMYRIMNNSASQATDSVVASYSVSSNNAPGTNTQFNFDTKVRDTHGAVTTGASWKFTAPFSGEYHVDLNIRQGSATSFDAYLYKSGSQYVDLVHCALNGGSFSGSAAVQLNAGDTIDIRPDAAGTAGGQASPYISLISIYRTGN